MRFNRKRNTQPTLDLNKYHFSNNKDHNIRKYLRQIPTQPKLQDGLVKRSQSMGLSKKYSNIKLRNTPTTSNLLLSGLRTRNKSKTPQKWLNIKILKDFIDPHSQTSFNSSIIKFKEYSSEKGLLKHKAEVQDEFDLVQEGTLTSNTLESIQLDVKRTFPNSPQK